MKVGDLVELSAYARKLKMYTSVKDNDVGLITSYDTKLGSFSIQWSKTKKTPLTDDGFIRKDLKYAKQRTA